MTQPSPDDLPQGPYRIDGHTVLTEDGTVFAWAHGKTPEQGYAIARAIAEISERMEQINQLAAQLIEAEKYNGWHQQALMECDRLRAELEQWRRLKPENERLRKVNEEHKEEIDRLRAEKAELVKNAQAVGAYASAIEAATIERCAKLADAHDPFEGGTEIPVGDAIRALAKENETEGK
jgi:hypothetical protein